MLWELIFPIVIFALILETWSFDSSTRRSDSVNYSADKREETILDIKQKIHVIQHITYFLLFLLVCFALINPWLQTRNIVSNKIRSIAKKRIKVHAERISSRVEDLLLKYETASRLLTGINENPTLIRCEPPYISEFIKYCKSTRNAISPKPIIDRKSVV